MYSFLNGDVTFIEKLSSLPFWRSLFVNSDLLMKESVFKKTPSKQAEMGRLPVPQGQAGGPSSHL